MSDRVTLTSKQSQKVYESVMRVARRSENFGSHTATADQVIKVVESVVAEQVAAALRDTAERWAGHTHLTFSQHAVVKRLRDLAAEYDPNTTGGTE